MLARMQSVEMSTSSSLTILASSSSACTVVAASRRSRPELDLTATVDAAHVGDVALHQIPEPACCSRPAIDPGKKIAVVSRGASELGARGAICEPIRGRSRGELSISGTYARSEHKSTVRGLNRAKTP